MDSRPRGELLPLLRELGIGFVPYSPLGHGFLTGQIRSVDDIPDDDWRKKNPRFVGESLQRNLRIVDEVEAVATDVAPQAVAQLILSISLGFVAQRALTGDADVRAHEEAMFALCNSQLNSKLA